MAVSDNFDAYANGGLPTVSAAVWGEATTNGAIQVSSGVVIGGVSGLVSAAFWDAHNFNAAQSAQLTSVNGGLYVAPAVRITSDRNFYAYFNDGTVQKWVGGSQTFLATRSAWNAGDNATIDIDASNVIRVYINGVQSGAALSADASLPSGKPGPVIYDNVGTVDNFIGTGEIVVRLAPLPYVVRQAANRAATF
jgi:hypothetical protein